MRMISQGMMMAWVVTGLGVSLLVGCASWRAERLSVTTEVESLPGIQVMSPGVYQDNRGCFAVGHLRARGMGAHNTVAHLHYQVVNGQGNVTWEQIEHAPTIRHNRLASRETASYSFRLPQTPAAGATLKVWLHSGRATKCSDKPLTASTPALLNEH